jgi:hypothetical protein
MHLPAHPLTNLFKSNNMSSLCSPICPASVDVNFGQQKIKVTKVLHLHGHTHTTCNREDFQLNRFNERTSCLYLGLVLKAAVIYNWLGIEGSSGLYLAGTEGLVLKAPVVCTWPGIEGSSGLYLTWY